MAKDWIYIWLTFFCLNIFPARRSFAKGGLEAVAFTSFRGTRTNRSIARAFGSLLVRHIGACTLIFLSPSPHLQPSGVPLLLRALFLQLKHLHLLEHCRLWRTHGQRPIASGIQNPCILDFACRPQWQIELSFGGSSLLSLTSAKCMQIRHDKCHGNWQNQLGTLWKLIVISILQ